MDPQFTPEQTSQIKHTAFPLLPVMLVGVGMFIAGIGVGYILFSQRTAPVSQVTPSPTVTQTMQEQQSDTYQTYEGTDFSIKYPSTYHIRQLQPVMSPDYPQGGQTVEFTDDMDHITITTATKPPKITLENALGQGPYSQYGEDMLQGKTIEEFIIDGVPGKGVRELEAGQAGTALDVVWIKNNTIYEATTVTPAGAKILEKMLPTLEFTN